MEPSTVSGIAFLSGIVLVGVLWFFYTKFKGSKEKSGTSDGSGGGADGKPSVHRK